MKADRSLGGVEVVLIVGICAVLLAAATKFATTQVIWSDETTQLAGLKLNPLDQVRFLLGERSLDPGVPYDRMPPLSYWLGWAWSQVFGASEMSFRMMGVAAMTFGCAAVSITGFMLGGRWGLVGAGLSFALSANVVTSAATIRAYPFLICFASFSLWGLVGFAQSRGRRRTGWLGLALCAAVLTTYCHFFGLVLGGAVLAAAWVTALRQREPVGTVVLFGILFLVLTAGVWPFALVSAEMSKTGAGGMLVGRAVRLAYRLVGHPAASVDFAALGLLGLSMATLVVLALWRWPRSESEDNAAFDHAAFDTVPVALAIGLAVAVLAGMFATLLDVFRPAYSAWAIPAAHLLVAIALGRTAQQVRTKWIARAATVTLIAAQAWIVSLLMLHGSTFSHGPHEMLSQIIRENKGELSIVHEEPRWTRGYFPLHFESGGALEQWRVDTSDGRSATTILRLPRGEHVDLASNSPSRRILVIGCAQQGQAEIRKHLRKKPWQPKLGPLATWLSDSPDWQLVSSDQHFSFVSAYALVFERVEP